MALTPIQAWLPVARWPSGATCGPASMQAHALYGSIMLVTQALLVRCLNPRLEPFLSAARRLTGTHCGLTASRRPHAHFNSSLSTAQALLMPFHKPRITIQQGPLPIGAKRPTGTHCGPASRRPHAHSDSTMLTPIAPC